VFIDDLCNSEHITQQSWTELNPVGHLGKNSTFGRSLRIPSAVVWCYNFGLKTTFLPTWSRHKGFPSRRTFQYFTFEREFRADPKFEHSPWWAEYVEGNVVRVFRVIQPRCRNPKQFNSVVLSKRFVIYVWKGDLFGPKKIVFQSRQGILGKQCRIVTHS
jgi:hypothetical protein